MDIDKKIQAMLKEQSKILKKSNSDKKIKKCGPNDRRWQKLRRAVFDKYGMTCMKCGSCKELHVDHIKPKSKYPKLAYKFTNLQILCKRCNYKKSNKNSNDYRMNFEQKEYEMKALIKLSQDF